MIGDDGCCCHPPALLPQLSQVVPVASTYREAAGVIVLSDLAQAANAVRDGQSARVRGSGAHEPVRWREG
jgi:hypothetical protein